ncbi:claudin-34-like [Rhynchocyon petersi]
MALLRSKHHQLAGFFAVTLAWLLCITSTGLVEWRVWNVTGNPPSMSGLLYVGMWKFCIYDHTQDGVCHYYTQTGTQLLFHFCASRNVLLIALIIGLLGKGALIFSIRNTSIRNPTATYSPLATAGFLYLCATFFVSISLIWCYYSLKINEGISFPPALQLPFQPDSQQAGGAFSLAVFAAGLMLYGSLGLLSKNSHEFP